MLDEKQSEQFHSLASSWVAAAFDTLSLLVDREVNAEAADVRHMSAEDTQGLIIEYEVIIRIPVDKEPETGEAHMLMKMADATVLGDLSSSGEGTPSDDLSEETKSVVQGLLDQMTVAAEAELKKSVDESISLGTPTILKTADADESLLNTLNQDCAGVEFHITCDPLIDSTLFLMIPAATFSQLFGAAAAGAAESPEPGRPAAATGQEMVQAASEPASAVATIEMGNLDLILDVEMSVMARLGQVEMPIREVLALGPGSIIEVGRSVEDPVELLVNDKLIARGEVVVVDEKFGLRLTEIVSPTERVKSLR